MDIILSKDERMDKLEKKLKELENKMERNFSRTSESFESFRDILLQLQKENAELKKDRDFLLEKYKEVVRKLGIAEPIKKAISENAGLIREIVTEGFGAEKSGKDIDDLFELIMNKKKITLKSAAKKLGVQEGRARYWALKLDKQNLINTKQIGNDMELMKKV
jgi:predicted nuclease with TOPRIM domain